MNRRTQTHTLADIDTLIDCAARARLRWAVQDALQCPSPENLAALHERLGNGGAGGLRRASGTARHIVEHRHCGSPVHAPTDWDGDSPCVAPLWPDRGYSEDLRGRPGHVLLCATTPSARGLLAAITGVVRNNVRRAAGA